MEANALGPSISIALNATDGTFNPAFDITARDAPVKLLARDLNLDGRPDLVVSTSSGTGSFVSVLLNSGGANAGCTPPPSSSDTHPHICTPADGATVSSPFAVSAAANSPTQVVRTALYLDGVKKYETLSDQLHTTLTASSGQHRVGVTGTDTRGVTTTTTENVTVSGTASCSIPSSPGVHLCSPTNGSTVASPVHISASAKGATAISYMQVYVDGTVKFTQKSVSTFSTDLAMSSGAHRVTVQAKDAAGNVYKSTVNITVGFSGTCTASSNQTVRYLCAR